MLNKERKKGKKSNGMFPAKISKTAQQSIPYKRIYDDHNTNGGIIEVKDGVFSKSYYISDASFSDIGEVEQDRILTSFEKILKTFDTDISYQITINARNIDKEKYNKMILLKYKDDEDEYNKLRSEHNQILLDKMKEGKNNIKLEKYLTINVESKNIEEALVKFENIENDLHIKFKRINMEGLKPLSIAERLEILHDIYNLGKEDNFDINYDPVEIRKNGLTSKDVIGPTFLDFSDRKKSQIGDNYAQVLFLRKIPSSIAGDLMNHLSSIPGNMLLSVHYDAQAQEKAVSFASNQVTAIGGEVVKQQRKLTHSGAMPDLISPKLATERQDAEDMLDGLQNQDKRLFKVTLVVAIFAPTEKKLNELVAQIQSKAKERIMALEVLTGMQEPGLVAALPLGLNPIPIYQVMTSDVASAIQPFSTIEVKSKNGFYYGQNAISKNLIIYNRSEELNQNGFILGSPGSGKSFIAKEEMYQVFLKMDNAQIFVLDPEQEYTILAKELGGQVFSIEPGGENYINPLDLDITKDKDGDPVAQKIDYIISLIERMLGGRSELSGYAKSAIDRALTDLYQPYIADLNKRGITIDRAICPTLKDLYNVLNARKEAEARNLAANIRIYCTGTLNLFAHHTNINIDKKMIVYDTSHILASNLQELGMQICLNDIWTRMVANRKREVRTWFYVDEAHLFLKMPSSAAYLSMVWKRARKWWGTPTFITQNVGDLLRSAEGNDILSTSDFAIMLNQAPLNKAALSEMFKISEDQQDYFSNVGSGEGLLFLQKSILPFFNHFPENTKLYKILSTKPKDAELIEKPSEMEDE